MRERDGCSGDAILMLYLIGQIALVCLKATGVWDWPSWWCVLAPGIFLFGFSIGALAGRLAAEVDKGVRT